MLCNSLSNVENKQTRNILFKMQTFLTGKNLLLVLPHFICHFIVNLNLDNCICIGLGNRLIFMRNRNRKDIFSNLKIENIFKPEEKDFLIENR